MTQSGTQQGLDLTRETARLQRLRRLTFILSSLLLLVLLAAAYGFGQAYTSLRRSIQTERMEYVEEISRQIINTQQFMEDSYCTAVLEYAAVLQQSGARTLSQAHGSLPPFKADELLLLSSQGELCDLLGRAVQLPTRQLAERLPAVGEVAQHFSALNYSEDHWLFCTRLDALVLDGREYLALVLAVPADEFNASLSVSLFAGRGASYIVNNNGSIRIKPTTGEQLIGGYNLLTSLSEAGADIKQIGRLQQSLLTSQGDSFLLNIGGEDWLISHAAIDDASSIVVVIPLNLTAAHTYAGLRGTIATSLVAVLALFVIALLLVSYYYYRDHVRRRQALAVAAKSEFFSKMSHDIRTPLNAVIGLELLARECSSEPQVKDYLSQSSASANYLLGIINDVLDMSRIESGKLSLACAPFDISRLLSEIKALIDPLAVNKSLHFAIELSQKPDCYYLGDEVRLKQVLVNLLSNAVKFTPPGGRVSLAVSYQPQQEQDRFCLLVTDNGMGISEEYLPQLFTPFVQERSSYTQQSGGSGLGLAIVHSLVTLMGGEVEVHSRPGAGSSFSVSLSLRRGEPLSQPGEQERETVLSYQGRRVLLAEDNLINQKVAAAILTRKFELTVEIAADGRRALELFSSSAPGYYDLILMDVKMPTMDGLEATRRIRALGREDAREIPILALSANAFEEDVSLSLASGMNLHLAKPIDIAALTQALRYYLS